MTKASTLPQHHKNSVRARDYFLPAAIALACASAAYAGADTTFDPALQKFTDFLEAQAARSSPSSALPAALSRLLQAVSRSDR